MDAITLLIQFGGVFAAAFLAFLLENVRERRRTVRWVREHLSYLSNALRQDASEETERRIAGEIQRQLSAHDAWLAAGKPSEMTEELWTAASEGMRTTVPDLSAILRTEALTVLPQDVAVALDRLERTGLSFQLYVDGVRDAQHDMLQAWHQRQVPLNDVDASKVRRFRSALAEINEQVPDIFIILRDATAAIDRWR